MKKILVLSDTHSHIDNLILKYAQKADEIWHAGDIGKITVLDKLSSVSKVRSVLGNIDDHIVRSTTKETIIFFL